MLETDERKRAISALNRLGERTLKRIIREHIQKKSQGGRGINNRINIGDR